MTSRQRTLDYGKPGRELAVRDGLIEELPIPARLKGTIRAIYRLGIAAADSVTVEEFSTSIAAISRELGCCPNTARSNAHALEKLALLSVSRPSGKLAAYRINWISIFEKNLPANQSEPLQNQSEPLQLLEGSVRSVLEGSEPTPSSKRDTTSGTTSKAEVAIGTQLALHLRADENELHKASSVPGQHGCWPFLVDQAALRDLATVQTLYDHAVDSSWIRPGVMTRLGFFSAAVQARTHAEDSRQPGKLFTWLVKRQAWKSRKHISDTSEETARRGLVKLDNPLPKPAMRTPEETHPDLVKDRKPAEPVSINSILKELNHAQ